MTFDGFARKADLQAGKGVFQEWQVLITTEREKDRDRVRKSVNAKQALLGRMFTFGFNKEAW